MSNKNFKFHFKNDKIDKADSYNLQLNSFTEAMEFAYNKLDQLNEKNHGYRIIGIYEIMMPRSYSKTN
jgi:hypothetical protein